MTRTTKAPRRDLCPAPECGNPVINDAVYDKRERPWHRACAARTLSDHFRTPLDLEYLDGESIDFTLPDEHTTVSRQGDITTFVWRAPRDFILHGIRLCGDLGLYAVFIGAENPLGCAPISGNAVFGDDLNGRFLDFGDFRVHMGLDLTLSLLTTRAHAKLTLVGELFDPQERKRKLPSRYNAPAIYGLNSVDPVGPGESTRLTAAIYIPTHFERIAVDDPNDWVIDDVTICGFAGDIATEVKLKDLQTIESKPRAIHSRITILPTFMAKPGEIVALRLRNSGIRVRPFCGRLIGNAKGHRDP